MYKLTQPDKDKLLALPESGMGYQTIRARKGDTPLDGFVFNSELFIAFGELSEANGRSHDKLMGDAELLEVQLESLVVLQASALIVPPPSDAAPGVAVPSVSSGGALAPSPRLSCMTTGHEGFVRFSAFSADHRIRADGGLEENTYATSVGDARFAVSGLAVAGRYALPNPSPAIYARTIVPDAGVLFLAGTTTPANGQAGGGVEVCFTKGSSAGAAFKPYEIPER